MNKQAKVKTGRGRPRNFDRDYVLEQAMLVFWRHGYEGASLADLTQAMGINKPSLYAAFGSKEELFASVVEKYVTGPVAFVFRALQEKVVRCAFNRLLAESTAFLTDRQHPLGCMILHSVLQCGPEHESIRKILDDQRASYENVIFKRLLLAQQEAELPVDNDAHIMAKCFVAFHQGLSAQAAAGSSKEELKAAADFFLRRFFPESDG